MLNQLKTALLRRTTQNTTFSGADPENVEPGGANSINYQTEPEGGGANSFFGLIYKDEQGACAGCVILNIIYFFQKGVHFSKPAELFLLF